MQLVEDTPSQVQAGGVPHPAGRYPIPGRGGGRHPISGLEGGTPPIQDWMGYSHPGLDGVHPSPPPSGDSSIASTCYAAGGMPLAFTQ